jgi:hypothetical protein
MMAEAEEQVEDIVADLDAEGHLDRHDDQRRSFDVFAAYAAPPESDLGAGRKKRYREHPLVELIFDFDH